MKLGLRYVNLRAWGREGYADALADAELRFGLESVWTSDHVVLADPVVTPFPYRPDGRFSADPAAPFPDSVVWLAWLAARTKTVRLGTAVLVLPLRNPLVLASQLATLDALAGGRVILGVGVGWLREEFAAVGIGFGERGLRAEECIGAMRALWSQDVSTFRGRFVSFEGVRLEPKPPGRRVPIVIGGHSRAAAERAGRIGDGFLPTPASRLPILRPIMEEAARRAGRDPSAIEVTVPTSADGESIRAARRLRARRIIIPAPEEPEAVGPLLERTLNLLAAS